MFFGMNLLLVPTPNVSQASHLSHTQFCTPAPLVRDEASLGHVWLSGSNLPFLIEELMRINVSVRNELVELDQRRRDLLTSVAAAQAQVEHVRSLLYEHSRQFMRLRVSHLIFLVTILICFLWTSLKNLYFLTACHAVNLGCATFMTLVSTLLVKRKEGRRPENGSGS